jgi:hypothetical protein
MIDKKLKLFGINLLHIIKSPDVFKFDILGVRLYSKDVIKQKNAAPTPACLHRITAADVLNKIKEVL